MTTLNATTKKKAKNTRAGKSISKVKKAKKADFKTGVGARRLLKLADFLDTLDARLFNLDSFINAHDSKYKPEFVEEALEKKDAQCGATACALGWCPSVFPRLVEWVEADWDVNELEVALKNKEDSYGKKITEFAVGDWLFDLNDKYTAYLFDSTYYPEGKRHQTAKKVAARIREFVKKGPNKSFEVRMELRYGECWRDYFDGN